MNNKSGRGPIISLIALVLIVGVLFSGVSYAWGAAADVFSTPAAGAKSIEIDINSGDTTVNIADELYAKGLIHNELAFRLWARIKGLDTQLKPGTYLITPGTSVDKIIATLLISHPNEKSVAVIDGRRLEQIAAAI